MGHGGVVGESVSPNTELVELRGSNIEVVKCSYTVDCEKEETPNPSIGSHILCNALLVPVMYGKNLKFVDKERLKLN